MICLLVGESITLFIRLASKQFPWISVIASASRATIFHVLLRNPVLWICTLHSMCIVNADKLLSKLMRLRIRMNTWASLMCILYFVFSRVVSARYYWSNGCLLCWNVLSTVAQETTCVCCVMGARGTRKLDGTWDICATVFVVVPPSLSLSHFYLFDCRRRRRQHIVWYVLLSCKCKYHLRHVQQIWCSERK